MARKTLTIFGCGYIGTEVARQALQQGWHLTALTRNPTRADQLRQLGLQQVITARLDNSDWHTQIPPRQDYVLNCVSSAGGGLDGYRQSYLDGQQSILDWASQGHIGTYIYTGATSVYSQSHGELVDETSPTTHLSPSGEILLQAERLITQNTPASIARWFILRLGGIYGPQRHHLLDALRSGQNTLPGTGDFFLNLIHRDDCASAILALFHAPPALQNRLYNLTDGTHATKADIVNWLARQLGTPPPRFDPDQTREREGRRRNPSGRLPNRRIDSQRIRSELNWHPHYPSYQTGYPPILQSSPH